MTSLSSTWSGSSCSICACCSPEASCSHTEQLALFKRQVYNGDFCIAGIGTRDTGYGTIHVGCIPDGATVVEAYLYWNLIGGTCMDGSIIMIGTGDIGSCVPTNVTGVCVGRAGNTCWSAHANPELVDGAGSPQDIYNFVYKANVGPTGLNIVTGNGPYCIDGLPYSNEGVACNGANKPNWPGCEGSQGATLIIIYTWNTGFGPTGPSRCREVSIYEGAVLITPLLNQPIFGGVGEYPVTHSTTYFGNVNLGFGIGDTQDYPDFASFNGASLAGSAPGNMFGPDEGNLLWADTIPAGQGRSTNTIIVGSDEVGGAECLCWFLFAYSGIMCPCTVQTKLTTVGSSSPGFSVNGGGLAVSLGDQSVSATVLVDTCDCLPSSNPLELVVNGTPSLIPPGGISLASGDTVDIKVNLSNCDLCAEGIMYCQGSSHSSLVGGSITPGSSGTFG